MTTILQLWSDAENYSGVNLPDAVWNRTVRRAVQAGAAGDWTVVEAIPFRDAGRASQPIGDLVEFYPSLPVVSARVERFLTRVDADGARYYPIEIRGMRYFIWSVQVLSKALDTSKAVLHPLPSGAVASVEVHAFHDRELVSPYFKLEQMGPTGPVYLRDDLYNAILAEGFTGFGAAEPVWSSDWS